MQKRMNQKHIMNEKKSKRLETDSEKLQKDAA